MRPPEKSSPHSIEPCPISRYKAGMATNTTTTASTALIGTSGPDGLSWPVAGNSGVIFRETLGITLAA